MHLQAPLMLMAISGIWTWVTADDWQAPADAAAVINPIPSTPEASYGGAAVYRQSCLICHGADGKGDGQGATYLIPKPASFADPTFQRQSDGAIAWKISTGRNAMAGFKTLSDTQRWQVVIYLRSFAPHAASAAGK